MNNTGNYSSTYISSATTTQVTTLPSTIIGLLVTETAAGTITVINGQGTSDVTIAVLKASIVEGYYPLNVACPKGIKITTGAASKVTVIYK